MSESTSVKKSIKITGKEYERFYFPFGGFLLVAKDLETETTASGLIYKTEQVRDAHSKYATTGVVVAKSLFLVLETEYETYVFNSIQKGDRICFSGTVPVYSPSPPFYEFDTEDQEKYITLHCGDVLAVICDTNEKQVELVQRFK